ncbi:hypothetical protein LVD17_27460 [Fulvivirga ulvae]|uniref:hypothetical protein n=1 Tax=Fulvivirga ulvae TaxID=2904245 RepID=UPI001F4536C2|nr:hypothetical protein [Fulvivirga ulvae]UII32028.1 hypothetical protein LVD17_27460 [Fulvivirga ulvae]
MFKKLLFALFLIFISPLDSMAQERLKGPRAKNLKAWEMEPAIASTVSENRPENTGPKAKNKKVWETKGSEEKQHITIEVAVEKDQLYGVKAKNTKPWQDNSIGSQHKIPRFIAPVLILLILGL